MILSIVEILLVLIVLKFGIAFIVYSMIMSKIIQFFTYSIINSKRLGTYWVNELVWYVPYIIITLLMCLTIFISEYLISHYVMHFSLFWKVTFQLFLGIISYLYLAYKFKIAEVSLVNSVAKTMLQKIRIKKI